MLDLLPTEILQLVTDHLNGLYIGLLWLCGNKRLNKHMGDERGVIHFEIHSKFCAWPSLVRNFHHLESFRFIPFPSSKDLPNWVPDARNFLDLSPTLQSLDLSGLKDNASFMKFSEKNRACFPYLTSLKAAHAPLSVPYSAIEALPGIEYLNARGFVLGVLNPALLPSNLKVLVLSAKHLDLSEDITFPEGLELLDLTFETCSIPNAWTLFSGLPVGLTGLSISDTVYSVFGYPDAKDIELLPRNLKSLCINLRRTPRSPTVDLLRALPRNLIKLRLSLGNELSDFFWEDDNYAAIKALPRMLQVMGGDERALELNILPTRKTAKFFPPGIVCDNPWVVWEVPVVNDDARTVTIASAPISEEHRAMKLPDSITNIIAHSSDYINMHMLPTSLTHLVLRMEEGWTPIERFEHLPKSLRSLSISRLGPDLDFPFHLLPTHVQDLTLFNYHPDYELNIEDCGALPRTLRALQLLYVGLESPTTAWSLMPPRLEELSITGDTLPLGCVEALPKMGVRTLLLKFSEDPSCQLSHQILMALPWTLTSLTLIDESPGVENINSESISTLPPGLTRLEICPPRNASESFKRNMEAIRIILQRGPTWFGPTMYTYA